MKILPENILDLLTPRMIAVWFMDDGSNTINSFTLNTHGFQKLEQLAIKKFLENRYDVSVNLIEDRAKHKLYIGKSDYEKFRKIVEPYIIPSMSYKIVNPRNDSAVLEMAGV